MAKALSSTDLDLLIILKRQNEKLEKQVAELLQKNELLQKQVEKREDLLRESEEKYHSLFENLNSAFVLIEPILDGEGRLVDLRYLMANPSVKKHLGKTPDQLVGRLYSEVFTYPERNPVFDIYEKVLSSGKPFKGEILSPPLTGTMTWLFTARLQDGLLW